MLVSGALTGLVVSLLGCDSGRAFDPVYDAKHRASAAWDHSQQVATQANASDEPTRWLVVAVNPASDETPALISASGGRIVRVIQAIGVFTVEGDSAFGDRLGKASGIEHVAPLTAIASSSPDWNGAASYVPSAEVPLAASASAEDDFLTFLQWGLDAIHAREAWATGARGRGVRVAILDTGIDPTHPDLVSNVNVSLARSFVPGQAWDVNTDAAPTRDHGTFVAGIIAAADNGFGIIGVAPEAEIVPIQVLTRPTGTGPPDAVLAGIVYAADIGADVINMSLGYYWHHRGAVDGGVARTAPEVAALTAAFSRATSYARARGCTIVGIAQNQSTDADHDRDLSIMPRDAPGVIAVSATGPLGWALDPSTDLDLPSFLSNYGRSVIDLAAPGGNLDFDLAASGKVFTFVVQGTSYTFPAYVFDGILSTEPINYGLGYEYRIGTSHAGAHVSGVAALIIGKNGGPMSPASVDQILRQSADDLGTRGRDAFYGMGRVNAFRAVE